MLVGELDRKTRQQQLDGWALRREFLKLQQDDQSLCEFLNKVGLWEVDAAMPREVGTNYSVDGTRLLRLPQKLYLDPKRAWVHRGLLVNDLRSKKNFVQMYASDAPLRSGLTPEFTFRFKLDDRVAAGVVTTASFWEMLLVTFYVDYIRGFRFQKCQRRDCPNELAFVAETGHKRKYCSQYCGHLESIRRNRRLAKKIKKGTKP
jgi:hypothetical protein